MSFYEEKINDILLRLFQFKLIRKKNLPEKTFFNLHNKISIDNIIDCGANEGQFLDYISNFYDIKKLSIFCFEPLNKEYLLLKKKYFNLKNINVYKYALGDVCKENYIYNLINHSPSSSILKKTIKLEKLNSKTKYYNKEKVQVTTLNNFFSGKKLKNVLLKIDTQGYDFKVLLGSSKILKKVRILIIEINEIKFYHKQSSKFKIYNFLFSRNFEFFGQYNCNYSSDGSLLFYDAVFIKK